MLPTIRQRGVLVLGCAVAAWWCLQVQPWLAPAGPGGGMVLFDVRGGIAAGVIGLIVAAAPAVLVAAVVSSLGHPISGVFVVAVAMTVAVSAGGGSLGFFHRHDLPEGWRWLVVETVVLGVGLAGTLLGLHLLRPAVRRRVRSRLGRGGAAGAGGRPRLARLTLVGGLSGLIAAATGALLTHVLVRTPESGQIIAGLILAFFVAGLLGHVVAPSRYPAGILASPLLVALGAYLWMLSRDPASTDATLALLYAGELPGLAVALPLHYASAGVLGATLGLATGEAVEHARPVGEPVASLDETA